MKIIIPIVILLILFKVFFNPRFYYCQKHLYFMLDDFCGDRWEYKIW